MKCSSCECIDGDQNVIKFTCVQKRTKNMHAYIRQKRGKIKKTYPLNSFCFGFSTWLLTHNSAIFFCFSRDNTNEKYRWKKVWMYAMVHKTELVSFNGVAYLFLVLFARVLLPHGLESSRWVYLGFALSKRIFVNN